MGRYALDRMERKGVIERHETGNFKEKKANTYFYIGQAEIPVKEQAISDLARRKQEMIQELEQAEREAE